MHLKKYLKINKISSKKFAERLDISEVSISRYINKVRIPDRKILNKISVLTNGFVTANDFYYEDQDEWKINKYDHLSIKEMVKKIKKGSIKHLAKAITLIESSNSLDQEKAEELIVNLPQNNETIRIGITGVPGVGKSTFIESFGLFLIEKGLNVGVLAIDPSSKKTGGSILGDKTRMQKLSVKDNAFIRPSPSSGHLGGVTKTTRESILCLEAGGYDIIFIETMGVGQAETNVYNMVDIFLVLLLPSGGDDLQGIKKGIIEIADLLVVNKADNNLLSSAEVTVNDYRNALTIIQKNRDDWTPKVLKCSSINSEGMSQVWNDIKEFHKVRKKNGNYMKNRSFQDVSWMWDLTENKLSSYLKNKLQSSDLIEEIESKIKERSINSNQAANLILDLYLKNFK